MRKTFKKKIVTALIAAGIIAGTSSAIKADASEAKYDDSNVSILTAVDNYVAANEYAFMDDAKDEIKYLADNASIEANVPTVETKVETNYEAENVTGSIKEITKEETVAAEPVVEETTTEATEETTQESTGEVVSIGYADFANKAIVSSAGTINIRSGAGTDNSIVGTIDYAGCMDVVEMGDEWSLVSSGNCQGYIKNEFVVFGDDARSFAESNLNKVAVITASALSLRESESTESDCLTMLPNGEKYRIVSIGDAWTKIEVDDTLSGYVSNEFIQIDFETTSAQAVSTNNEETTSNDTTSNDTSDEDASSNDVEETTTEEAAEEETYDVPASSLGGDVVNYALQFVGNPYVYGGTSLTNGADCSGFVMRIYEHFGYQLPRTADVQGTVGTPISLAALAPGDLLFYDHGSGSIQHVAIYIGDGRIVHASNSRTGIITSNAYYSTPCRAVRIIN